MSFENSVLVKRFGSRSAEEWVRGPNQALSGIRPVDVMIASGPIPVRDIVLGPEAGAYR